MPFTMLIFSLALLVHLHLCRGGDPCPLPEQMRYCTCTRKESASQNQSNPIDIFGQNHTESPNLEFNAVMLTVVECNVNRSVSALVEAVAMGLHRRQVDKLTVYRVPPEKEHALARLPDGWLKSTRVRHIELLDSKLSGDFLWYGKPFEGQEQSLLILTVNNCSLYGALTYETQGTVNTKKMDMLPCIEIIDFSHNLLTTVAASAFRRPSANLSTIILSRNSIENIESGAFENVLHLKSVDLSHNMLNSLVRGVFAAPAKFLETLDLSWNFLKALPVDFFTDMPLLKNLNLEKNFLYSMPEKPWSTVWSQLNFVNVEGNFIKCDCNLLWLTTTPSTTETISPATTTQSTTEIISPAATASYSAETFFITSSQNNYSADFSANISADFSANNSADFSANNSADFSANAPVPSTSTSAASVTFRVRAVRKIFKGKCSYYRLPISQGLEFSLDSIKKDLLMCND